MASNLNDTTLTEMTETSQLKIAIGIMITVILLLIFVPLGCPKANNFRMPRLQHVPQGSYINIKKAPTYSVIHQ